ncbi:MAG: hypothetical protein PWQ59_1369 [Thermoanaerobacterium sp.]|nr:hypothetical protein [Thermoanaerobacterium sp.]MDI3529467.1 hypothetical protein [Thermoanaerobacter sp.]
MGKNRACKKHKYLIIFFIIGSIMLFFQTAFASVPSFTFSGSWGLGISSRGTPSTANNVLYSDVVGDTITINFTGSQINIYYIQYTTDPYGRAYGKFDVILDGSKITTVNTYGDLSRKSYSLSTSFGSHTLKLVHTALGRIIFDSIVIDSIEIQMEDVKTGNLPIDGILSYNINISNVTKNSIEVSWSYNDRTVSYNLYLNGQKVANTTNKQYIFNNLTPGTKYDISVQVVKGTQTSYPTTVTTYTLPDKPPSPPVLSVSGQTLQWTKNDADQVKSFDIYQNGNKIATVDGNILQYQVTGLERGIKYNFYITATNIAGTSQPSNTISITPPTPPSPPTGLQAKDIYNNQVTIIWNKNIADDNVSKYSVYVNGSKIADVSSNTTSYTLQNLDPKTTYQVYVTATNGVGESNPSQSIYVTTSLPGQVKNLHTQKLSSNSAELAWDANPVNDGVTKYIIYVNGNKVGETTDNSYTLSDIQQGKVYDVQVSAVNSVGEGQKSNIIQVTTSNITNISDISQVGDIFNAIITLFKNTWFLLAFVIMILALPYLVIAIKLIFYRLK